MIILNALYKKPIDEAAFQDYYEKIHMPLVKKVPGLLKSDVEMVGRTFMGERNDFYMLARMYYKDKDIFGAAMKSNENLATSQDLQNFATAGVSLFITESVDS